MNRRDLLKLFGVGATVAPIVDGLVKPVQAKIVEPPKVELCKESEMPEPGNMLDLLYRRERLTMQVRFIEPNGRVHHMEAATMLTHCNVTPIDVTSVYGGSYREYIAGMQEPAQWELRGVIL